MPHCVWTTEEYEAIIEQYEIIVEQYEGVVFRGDFVVEQDEFVIVQDEVGVIQDEVVVERDEIVVEQEELQQQQAVVLEENGRSGDIRPEPLRENGKRTENVSLRKEFFLCKIGRACYKQPLKYKMESRSLIRFWLPISQRLRFSID